MSQPKPTAEQLFGKEPQQQASIGALEALKEAFQAIAPGLNGKQFVEQVGAELYRLGVQGSAEIAAGLFGDSNLYVPYGRGQWPSKDGQEAGQAGMTPAKQEEPQQPTQERGGIDI